MIKTIRNFTRKILLLTLSLTAWGANFSFFTTMRAGFRTGLSWELGAGSTPATVESNVNYEWNTAAGERSWRPGDLPQSFRIGFDRNTNTGYVTVYNSSNAAITASYTNANAALLQNTVWTLPGANFFASANTTGQAGSINVENLTFSPGVQVLSGSLPNSIGAADPGPGSGNSSSLSTPIIFDAAGSGGSWSIAGTIRMNGLLTINGTASGNDLIFSLGAGSTDTPEGSTFALFGIGLLAVVGASRYRKAHQRI